MYTYTTMKPYFKENCKVVYLQHILPRVLSYIYFLLMFNIIIIRNRIFTQQVLLLLPVAWKAKSSVNIVI